MTWTEFDPKAQALANEPVVETTTTPSGIEISFQWEPKRKYQVRYRSHEYEGDDLWREVPSVTTVLGVLDKSGPLISAKVVEGHEEAMVISAMGIVLRTPVSSISEQGRAAQGVALMNPRQGDRVACIALLTAAEDDASPDTNGTERAPRTAAQLVLPGDVESADEDELEDDEAFGDVIPENEDEEETEN